MKHLPCICAVAISLAVTAMDAVAQNAASTDLVGLWQAKRGFDTGAAGRLVVDRAGGGWRAAIAGRTAAVRVAGDTVAFALPDSSGRFVGRFDAGRSRITGHWVQPRTVTSGNWYASPLALASCGANCFAGTVIPAADELTFFIRVERRPDGRLAALLRNPERNLGGQFIRLARIEADGPGVRLLDRRDSVLFRGELRDGVMTVYIPGRGGSYDFQPVRGDAFTFFYPRGRPTASYTYVPPRQRDDGWPVGTLDQAGISRERISAALDSLIDTPVDSIGAHKLHSLVIARHGRIVLEEYFYGADADIPHETRSASKTVTTVMAGAAMQAGARVGPATPVYATLRPGAAGLDARKRALTLEHLLNMASGYDCDDSGDRPGDEDVITQQADNPDWASVILALNLVREPGDSAVYCSINPHLAGVVLSRATGRWLPDLWHDLVAQPLGIDRYYIPLTPTEDAYMGGGWLLRIRDFMKLGQVYLNGGTWQGRRIVSEDWVRRSTEPRYPMGTRARYGYLWWMMDYPYAGRTIRAYFASGNGGQYVMVIPELDLVIGANGGNYNDRAGFQTVVDLIPRVILPAVAAGR
ncbi:MAG TPA: serine hydrolase [Longimicrobium sp.]